MVVKSRSSSPSKKLKRPNKLMFSFHWVTDYNAPGPFPVEFFLRGVSVSLFCAPGRFLQWRRSRVDAPPPPRRRRAADVRALTHPVWDDARLPSQLLKRERPTSLLSGLLHQPLCHQDDLSSSVDQDQARISKQTPTAKTL